MDIREIEWLFDTREVVCQFLEKVKKEVGHALFFVQVGETHPKSKQLKELGSGVYEIISNFMTDTYRAVYAVKIGTKIYVLHAFKKKSRKGISTPKKEIELIKKRLRAAKNLEDKK